MRIYIMVFLLTGLFIQAQAQAPSDTLKKNDAYTEIRSEPQFPGGDAAFALFIKENLI